MERPPSLPPPNEPARGSSLVPIALAGMLLAMVCVVLFFLTIGFFGSILLMAGGVFALAALHYIVWGWWLSKFIRADVAAEEEQDRKKLEGRPGSTG